MIEYIDDLERYDFDAEELADTSTTLCPQCTDYPEYKGICGLCDGTGYVGEDK